MNTMYSEMNIISTNDPMNAQYFGDRRLELRMYGTMNNADKPNDAYNIAKDMAA